MSQKLSRKILCMILTFLLMAGLCACGKKEPTWQEQYDLGMKYLNEKDYEEAVTVFQVAISIDPKQQPAYIGVADAYVGMAGSGDESIDVEKCYEAAEENYRKALDIDSETEEVYEKFANMYVEKGDTKKAEELIEEARKNGLDVAWTENFNEEGNEIGQENSMTEENVDDSVYIGEYMDSEVNDAGLEIAVGNDGKYVVQIRIYRLIEMTDGVGELTDEGLNFTATDMSGNPISGVITVENNMATVTFTNSTWEYLENGYSVQYQKSSDTPTLWPA